MLNQQRPEKRSYIAHTLDVQSIFATIQGEGPFCGTPATFIRLAGCNLQCPGCDTDYTSMRHPMSVSDILDSVQMTRSTIAPALVVITGGEPFRQPIGDLIDALVDSKFYVQIETNGSLPAPPVLWDLNPHRRAGAYIVCSPKAAKVHPSVAEAACAYKYVMHADSIDPIDGLTTHALGLASGRRVARPNGNFKGPIYLQPMDSQDPEQNARNRAVCVASCLKHGYILQLQIHKLLGME